MNNSDDEREKEQKDKEKQARMEASLREREKEVQRTLATHLRDRDKEREQHKHDEAVQHFNALLADLVSGATCTDYVHVACLVCSVCTLQFCLLVEEFLYDRLHRSLVSSYLWLCSQNTQEVASAHIPYSVPAWIFYDAEFTLFLARFFK